MEPKSETVLSGSSWSTPTTGTVVILAGCSNEKSDKPGAAEVVYRSRLFHMARMFAESFGDAWYILSGKYGVLSPSSPIERYDYDLTWTKRSVLSEQDALTQTQWAMHAADQLCVRLESDQVASGVVHLVIVCGATYAAITDYLPLSDPRWQFIVHQPLEGLPVGKRFAWLRKQVSADDLHSIRLNDNQLGMLRRFDNNLEQHLYQFGARRQCSMALWKKGLVVQVQDHPTNEGWTLFDITDKGRRLMTKIKRSEERRKMPDTVSLETGVMAIDDASIGDVGAQGDAEREPIGVPISAARVVAGMIAGAMQSRCVRSVPDGGEDAGYLALVAGSIRRGKQRVKDIEIVACPRWSEEADPTDLLGERTIRRNVLYHEWATKQSVIQWIKPGTNDIVPWRIQESGKYWRGYIPSLRVFGNGAPELSCKVDIFLTEQDNFGLIYLIRTGSAEFSTEVATYALRVGYKVDRGYLWRVRGLTEPKMIPTPTEADVFRALNLQWVEPEDRTSADMVRAGWDENAYQHLKLYQRFPEM